MYNYKSLQVAQLLQEHLSSLQNFIIKKYLKQQFDNDQALWPLYNWRYKDLSISRDKKVMTPQWRNALSTSITELLLLPKFDNSSSCVTWDKEICQLIMS